MAPTNNKHVVLVTTKQPSSNPRLVKEATALTNEGYTVSVVYNFWGMWAEATDEIILKKNKNINWLKAGSHPVHSKAGYWFTRLRYKFYKMLAVFFQKNLSFQVLATAQFYSELKKKAGNTKANLYIAHNAGALPAAAYAAKKNNARYAFDAEDFHRSQEAGNIAETESIALIEDSYFSQVAFITAASPLIAAEYKKHYPSNEFTVINNVFSRQQQLSFYSLGKTPLKLFWFSQTVGTKRGVQDVIAALNKISSFPIEFSILGDINNNVKQVFETSFTNSLHKLVFIKPCSEEELIAHAAQNHIGLALEPGFSINNNIALSNKLFTYLLAGNAVIMSTTAAQELFYQQYPQAGWCYKPGDTDRLASIIEDAFNDTDLLNDKRQAAWQLANTKLNWENEQHKFLELVKAAV